ncbi:MAG: acyl-CoA thioesterase [Burkholderiales bacterium]
MGVVAVSEFRVGWGDCAPSGAVFYPNYFRWFDKAVWDLFERAGQPIIEIERRYGTVGIPLVDMQVSFIRPCRLQFHVRLATRVVEWQAKRFKIRHEVSRDGDPLVECVETRFWGVRHPDNPERLISAPIPPEVVAAFEKSPIDG